MWGWLRQDRIIALSPSVTGRIKWVTEPTATFHHEKYYAWRCLFNTHRSFTDLKRDHILFSMATPANSNSFLIFWDETNKEMEPHIIDRKTEYRGQDYKPNMWHSICTTWDSTSGLVQLWFDGRPSIRKFISSGSIIRGATIIIIGQVKL